MSEQYNQLKGKFPALTIERHQVSCQPKTKQDLLILSTYIYYVILHFRRKMDAATEVQGGLLGVVF
jgi:hypothetical protein